MVRRGGINLKKVVQVKEKQDQLFKQQRYCLCTSDPILGGYIMN